MERQNGKLGRGEVSKAAPLGRGMTPEVFLSPAIATAMHGFHQNLPEAPVDRCQLEDAE
jgi:hypothetical protein